MLCVALRQSPAASAQFPPGVLCEDVRHVRVMFTPFFYAGSFTALLMLV
jgi:hypothetical protein